MGKIIFILGGARSGKSTYALQLAKKYKNVAFLATSEAKDQEMERRIKLHQKNRPAHWKTFEEPKDIVSLIKKIGNRYECLIIDCLTILVSNLLLDGGRENLIEKEINQMISLLKSNNTTTIIASNEVGLGIVPVNALGRNFRDLAGKLNQLVAKKSDEVIFMIAGLPQRIKEEIRG